MIDNIIYVVERKLSEIVIQLKEILKNFSKIIRLFALGFYAGIFDSTFELTNQLSP